MSVRIGVLSAFLLMASMRYSAAAVILDQEFAPEVVFGSGFGLVIGNLPLQEFDRDAAQTFTVGVRGILATVELALQKVYWDGLPPSEDLLLRITNTANGEPADSVALASITIPQRTVGIRLLPFVKVDVRASGIAVSPGDVLALVLTVPGGGLSAYYWGHVLVADEVTIDEYPGASRRC